jgi:hypothetical protein
MTGQAAPSMRGEKRIAASLHASPQLRHTTFCAKAMQLPIAMTAKRGPSGAIVGGAEKLPRRNWRRETIV